MFPAKLRPALFVPLMLVVVVGVVAAGRMAVLPPAGAQQGTPTLVALRNERTAMAEALTPSVVAVAQNRPNIGQARGTSAQRTMATSGFVVDEHYVVTDIESMPLRRQGGAWVEPGQSMWLMAHDGTEFGGKVVGTDLRNLLVLIRMDDGHPALPSVKFGDSDKVAMGSSAMGLGNCLDSLIVDRVVNFSFGTISGFYRFEPVDVMDPTLDPANPTKGRGDPYKGNVLETDVAIHPGDHGGPLFNLDGELIGMMCLHHMAGRHLGCAVPSNQIRAVLPQLKAGVTEQDLARGYLGMRLRKPEGDSRILVTEVEAGSPAAKAGLKVGLELTRVDNMLIPDFDRLGEMIGTRPIVIEHAARGGMFENQRVQRHYISHGVPIGTHMQLTVRDPETGREQTVLLVVGQKEEDF